MRIPKGFVLLLCLSVFALTDAQGIFGLGCEAPVEGEWTIDLNPPNPNDTSTNYLHAQLNFTLTRESENIYTGDGMVHSVYPAPGRSGPINVLAIYRPGSCTLTGGIILIGATNLYSFQTQVTNGRELIGEYSCITDGEVRFDGFGIFNMYNTE